MTEGEKLAYLAGIIDGEGCILIKKKKVKKGGSNHTTSYSMGLSVVSIDKILINWLVDNFNGRSGYRGKEKKENWRDAYHWTVSGYDAYTLLRKAEPFLVIKKEQVRIAAKFWEGTQRIGNVGRGIKPLWKVKRQEEYYQKLKDMHHEICSPMSQGTNKRSWCEALF